MKILVTGASGFVGKNLIATLENIKSGKDKTFALDSNIEIFKYDINTEKSLLEKYTAECDFVIHLAGVNRPKTEEEFKTGNFDFTSELLSLLEKNSNKAPVLVSSSIQAALENPYGISKKMGEDAVFDYGRKNDVKTLVYRLPNVFGKWCKPNYNSAVATFCYNIARDLPITVNDRSYMMTLVYIDDVVGEFINALCEKENKTGDFCEVPVVHKITLGEIADMLCSFKESRQTREIPLQEGFSRKLYAMYLSYLPEDEFAYPLKMNVDDRGSFTEFLKTENFGQVSVNVSKPHITKGNHWHHTKNEKFLVVSGKGVIRFKKIGSDDVVEYFVSGEKLEVVDIPAGYTHNIENLGEGDMVTIMWANEKFDPEKPDTYFLEV